MSGIRSQATPARDELAALILAEPNGWRLNRDNLAAQILAAGWSKPRTVNSAAELDALPVGSVVRVNDANDVISHVCLRYSDGWFTTLHESMVYPLAVTGSVTVLFTPGDAGSGGL